MSAIWCSEGMMRAAGQRLEYACFGPPPSERPTLVLLHEGLGCVALWRDFPRALAEATGWGVFAFSRAGYGKSDVVELPRPLDYMTREARDVLPDVLSEIGIARCVLVGHSDGATIAAIYAGSVPDPRVRGVVLMAPHFFVEETGLAEIAKAREHFDNGALRVRMAKYHRDPDNAFRGWNDAWLAPGFRDWNVADAIDHIQVPILVIQGRQDQYGTLRQIEEVEIRSRAPVDTLILDGCGHAPFLERRNAVVAAITAHCAPLDRLDSAI